MSYILDALKKSEQERAQGNVPDLNAMHTPIGATRHSRPLWPYVVGVLVLINVIVLWIWLQPQQHEPGVIAPQTVAPTAANSIDEQPRPATVSTKPAVVVKKALPEEVMPQETQTQVHEQPGIVDQAAEKSAEPQHVKPVTDTPGRGRVIVASSPLTDEQGNLIENASIEPAARKDQRVDLPAQTNGSVMLDSVQGEEYVQPVTELPQSIKRKLPRMSYAGHVYSDNPERRSVLINGRKLREGYVVDGELVLEEIHNDHAVFSMDGYRFRINMLRDWPME